MTNKPSWYKGVYGILGKWSINNSVSANHGLAADEMIKLIQDLLDRKAREIEACKRYGLIVQVNKPDQEAFVEWNAAIDEALSILKEE